LCSRSEKTARTLYAETAGSLAPEARGIRRRDELGEPVREIARSYAVSRSTILKADGVTKEPHSDTACVKCPDTPALSPLLGLHQKVYDNVRKSDKT
jgi:hypothetical protein